MQRIVLAAVFTGIYVCSYLGLSLFGEYSHDHTGVGRMPDGRVGRSETYVWKLWLTDRPDGVSATVAGRIGGFFYYPLIQLDRSFWHHERRTNSITLD